MYPPTWNAELMSVKRMCERRTGVSERETFEGEAGEKGDGMYDDLGK